MKIHLLKVVKFYKHLYGEGQVCAPHHTNICKISGSLFGEKIARKGKGKGGGVREPVDKHMRLLFRPIVIILPNICQYNRYLSINFACE